ncbi:hypothetical protein E4T56_gene2714 [Termitomyces sp. T112]|nr:hypothetical protein E4T56_gene2714 [Termitomyces sp. T112]
MNGNEFVETSDDEELELKLLECVHVNSIHAKGTVIHDHESQTPRKRRKLYHEFESNIPPTKTLVHAPSVTWLPTSSSPATSPKSSSLLQTPPYPHKLSPSVLAIWYNDPGRLSQDPVQPQPEPGLKNDELNDELPPVLSNPSFIPPFEEMEPPDIHISPIDLNNSNSSPTLDRLPTPSSSPPEMTKVDDAEPPIMHERSLSSTPLTSSPGIQIRSLSPDPMSLFDVFPSQATGSVDLVRQEISLHKDERPEDLPERDSFPHNGSQFVLRATPPLNSEVPSVSSQHMSFATPPPPQASPRSPPYCSPPILPDLVLRAPNVQDDESNLLNDGDIPSISRYPLRKRAPAQLKPYTVEKYHYKQALSANPDAIVNIRDAPWQPIEEAQDNSDSGQWQLRTKATHREDSRGIDPARPALEERPPQYSELLQDLPSSEEESKSMQRFSKEAKCLERQRRKAQLKKEKQARLARGESEGAKARARPKAFPVKRSSRSTPRSRTLSISSNDSQPSLSRPGTHSDASRSRSRVVPSSPMPTTSIRISSPTSPPNSRSSSPHYINHDEADDFDGRPNTRGSVDFSDSERRSEHSSDVDDENILPKVKMPKGAKTLLRMYPYSMIEQFVARSSEPSKPKSKTKSKTKRHTKDLSESEHEETAVLSGRSRSGWACHSWKKEIKGDTESSDNQYDSDQDSPLDNESVQVQSGFKMRIDRQGEVHDVVNLTGNTEEDDDDDVDEEDDSDGVDDLEIEAYLAGDGEPKTEHASSGGRLREESLIDWMLTRTRTIGGSSRRKTRERLPDRVYKPKRADSSRYKIDVVIQGGRRECQTRSNLDGYIRKEPANPKSRKRSHAPASRRARSGSIDVQANDGRDDVMPVPELGTFLPKKDRKQQERERRARAKGNGVHIFTSDCTHLVSGRKKRVMMTVNIEDVGFSQAITPLPQGEDKPTNCKERVTERRPSSGFQLDEETEARPQARLLRLDCGVEVLQSGLTFGANSYIRKGWLHELISVIHGEQPPPLPAKIIFHGIDFGPDSSVDNFIKSFKQVFDELSAIVTNLPGAPDTWEQQEWRGIQRAANQSLSWLLASATELDIELLKNTVREQVSTFVDRMRGQSVHPLSLDTFTLAICWFAVEISARLDLLTEFSTSGTILRQSVPLLMDYLWSHGVESVIASLKEGVLRDDSILDQYVAELWVSLFHLLDSRNNLDDSTKKLLHPFSFLLQETLKSTPRLLKNPLEASEWVWHSVFGLCALTQFSVHGMTTSVSRLPASWELVVCALKQVRLTVDVAADGALSQQSLHKRDFYAKWITQRCFLLRNRWHWELDEVSDVLDCLSKVFQSRNFAGLHHELQKPDYPFFLIHNDWSVFEKLDPRDTAFIVFLKLLFQAVGRNEITAPRPLSPKAKKMLSMAVPVAKLPFSKRIPTTKQDLSMLYNKLSAVAVAIYLDPSSHVQRMTTARGYVDFSDADDTARCGVIRGMIYLAIMLKKARLPTDSISHWMSEMATILANEHKALGEKLAIEHKTSEVKPAISVMLLVGAVRQILQVFQADSDYPEFALLEALDPIIKVPNLSEQPAVAEQIRQMLQVFIDARKGALPPHGLPTRKLTTGESQESQDDYPTMDIDYDDPELLAALDAYDFEVPMKGVSEFTGKEEKLNIYMMSTLSWWVWRNLNKRVTNTGSFIKRNYIQTEVWLECWLGCADVTVHAGRNTKSWQMYLDMRTNWKDLSESTRKLLHLSFMKRLLKIDPMTYSDYKNMYLEALLTALVSIDPMNERDFIHLVLDIDGGQHPLLVGLSIEELVNYPDEQEPTYILQSIIKNLADCFANTATSLDERETLIGLCIRIYQAMKHNSSEITQGSLERQRYNTWCREIAKSVQAHRELCHERLAPWKNWYRELS